MADDLRSYPLGPVTVNIVLILADDLGWGDVQTNNPDSAMTTPRIDGIAAAGAYFTDTHSPSSVCSPTRYGLLTGRYAWRSWLHAGVLNAYDRLLIGADRPTLGTLLQGHGYRTAAIVGREIETVEVMAIPTETEPARPSRLPKVSSCMESAAEGGAR